MKDKSVTAPQDTAKRDEFYFNVLDGKFYVLWPNGGHRMSFYSEYPSDRVILREMADKLNGWDALKRKAEALDELVKAAENYLIESTGPGEFICRASELASKALHPTGTGGGEEGRKND